ncbi:hypothetical protein [Oceanihabitans sediminis]|uniref:hypothetical protein n=1 Tax=Oceanihabitans sediminis TaxID=1812012 RepID=UPI000930B731|nr:hypothetical protein [Oceanihabitans sediminis]MDX1279264.1 hypothetical protein [Oceanihabitans sediminis]MDX1773741.1 hypothetical protein [Oceanihabitans sediminis]
MKTNKTNLLSLFLILLAFIFSNKLSAQNNDIPLFDNMSLSRTAGNTTNQNLEEYVYENIESGYFENGNLSFAEENFKRLYIDMASLNSISRLDLNNVEAIIIKISSLNDLNTRINYANTFSGLSNLKCVYINSEIQVSKFQIENLFTNVPSTNILNYYGVNIPR